MTKTRIILGMLITAYCSYVIAGQDMALKAAYKDYFYIGASFGKPVMQEDQQTTLRLIARQFNAITAGNEMKWGPFNPEPDVYHHGPADDFVSFGTDHGMYIVGHVLFWHSQTPEWVFQSADGKMLGRDALLGRMRQRVRHVAQRYQGKIHAWDVVNESIMDDGKLRDSEWTRIIGDDFIEQAFRIAAEELPEDVELIYNDYSMTGKRKRDAVVAMIRAFKQKGVRIDGVGMQGHWSINGPSVAEIEESIVAFASTGVAVHITELDVDVLPRSPQMWSGNADVKLELQQDPKLDPYAKGLPDAMQAKLAERYAGIFGIFIAHQDKIKRVTFWGPTDKYSWLNNWPIKGRTNYPLLFDREGEPKPAYHAVMQRVQ